MRTERARETPGKVRAVACARARCSSLSVVRLALASYPSPPSAARRAPRSCHEVVDSRTGGTLVFGDHAVRVVMFVTANLE